MTKNIRTQIGKVIGKTLNSYHARVKPVIDDIKFKICLHQFFKSNKLIDFINDIDNEILSNSKIYNIENGNIV